MIIAIDFETFYSADFSLSKISTEAYIRHPRFEVIGVSISTNGQPAIWYPQPEVEQALRSLPWSTSSLLAYNTLFDGAILAWHYNLYPALYLDAMGMARALGKTYKGGSLAKVLNLCGLGAKGDYVAKASGMRYADFEPHELAAYGAYCCNDTNQTVALYRLLQPQFPVSEARIQDLNLRLFIEPVLHFDVDALNKYKEEVVDNKKKLLTDAGKLLSIEWESEEQLQEQLRTILASNDKFAAILTTLGVDPPTKLSPKTGKETWAFAKTNPDFMELEEHEDPAVQALIASRLGIRSTIEETRAATFLDAATRGVVPVAYNYCGANTLRFSGSSGTNFQNLKRGGRLRDAIMPPAGHYIICADLSQIECRLVNYLAGQDDVVEAFRLHDTEPDVYSDVYCILASKLYGRTITRKDKFERQSGKVGELSLGYGGGWKAYKRGMYKESGIVVKESEARQVVDIYRETHPRIKELWSEADSVLSCLKRNLPFDLGREGILDGNSPEKGIGLPNELYINYPELWQEFSKETGYTEWYYTAAKRGRPEKKKIYGSVVVQNMIEALGRIILTDAWLRLSNQIRIVLHTHDELAGIIPYADLEKAKEIMYNEMIKPIPWAPGLPIQCEIKYGLSYGGAR